MRIGSIDLNQKQEKLVLRLLINEAVSKNSEAKMVSGEQREMLDQRVQDLVEIIKLYQPEFSMNNYLDFLYATG